MASLVVAHEEDISLQIRARPDSPFYGLKVALDKLSLLLTFDQTAKAHKALEIAKGRLAEINLMLEENNIRATERARLEYEWALEKTKTAINSIQNRNATEQIRQELELQKELEEHEGTAERVREKIRVRFESNLTEENRAMINSILDSVGNFIGKIKIEVIDKINDTKIKIKLERGLSDEEIEDEIEEIRNKTGLTEAMQEKAEDAIEDAKEEITEVEEELLSVNDTETRNSVLVLLNQAKEHLILTETSFNEGSFGEAYGHATAAEQLAENAHDQLEKLTGMEDDGRGRDENETDGDRVCIQVITPARNKETGECREFPTPCDVPREWDKVDSCQDMNESGRKSGPRKELS